MNSELPFVNSSASRGAQILCLKSSSDKVQKAQQEGGGRKKDFTESKIGGISWIWPCKIS